MNRVRSQKSSEWSASLHDCAQQCPPTTRRRRNLQALHWRLALHSVARGDFLRLPLLEAYVGGAWPVDPNLMLDRLTDNLDSYTNAAPKAPDDKRAASRRAKGAERWQKKQQ